MTLTIAICTFNRSRFLEKCLGGLCKQLPADSFPPILVIDNSSTDDTRQVCDRYSNHISLTVVGESKIGLSHARNTALANCNTEYIAFLDDDGIPDPQWVRAVYEGVESYKPDIFGGPYSPYYIEPKPAWFDDEFGCAHVHDSAGIVGFPYCFSGGNMGWRSSILRNMGGFNPDLGMVGKTMRLGEETALQMELWKQPALKRVLLPSMHMTHYVSPEKMSLRYIAKRSFTYGKQLQQIDPANPLLSRSLTQTLFSSKFGLPLLLRLFLRDRRAYPHWKTFASKFLSLHCIGLGAQLVKKKADGKA